MSASNARHRGDISIRYGDRIIEAKAGQRLLDSILGAGLDHRHVCGGHGFCTSCRVQVLAGASSLSPVSALERERLGREAGRLRLACQTRVYGDVHVQVPPSSTRFSLKETPAERAPDEWGP